MLSRLLQISFMMGGSQWNVISKLEKKIKKQTNKNKNKKNQNKNSELPPFAKVTHGRQTMSEQCGYIPTTRGSEAFKVS